MTRLLILAAALLGSAPAQAQTPADRSAEIPATRLWLAGNTSSNSSSNTSSNSSSGRSSYVHSHTWSVDSDDGRRRRIERGSTRIERHAPGHDRRYRRHRGYRD